jgi:hypothetical protein
MKLSHTLLICACLVFAGINFSTAVTPAPVPAPQQRVQEWEYLMGVVTQSRFNPTFREFITGNGKEKGKEGGSLIPDFDGWLDRAGEQGWELVSVSHVAGGDTAKRYFYFKRPKR